MGVAGALLAFGNSRGAEGLKWSGVRHGVEDGDLGKIIHGSLWAMEKTWDFVPFFFNVIGRFWRVGNGE